MLVEFHEICRFNLMRCRFKASSVSRLAGWLERPSVHRHIAMELMLTRSLAAGARMALQNQLWWRLVMQAGTTHPSFDVMGLLTRQDTRCTVSTYEENQIVYSQGDPADSVFYVQSGRVKVTVISELGKASSQSADRTNSVARQP
jgi:hypothetical protein